MDYLFLDNLSGIPKNNKASSFYLVDKELRYVSFHDSELYYLSYVDCDKIHEIIKETDNEYEETDNSCGGSRGKHDDGRESKGEGAGLC